MAGGCTTATVMMVEVVTCNQYVFDWADINVKKQNDVDRIGAVLTRVFGVATDVDGQSDEPTAPGVSLSIGEIQDEVDYAGPTPLMAVHGEPLAAMVQNLGQTDNGYVSLGDTNAQALSQGFTTGSDVLGYRLQGVGVNIEGSDVQFPDGPSSVSVAVHADSGGKPGAKLFDLVSPTEFAAGHSFFEAPPGTNLAPNISYVLVWSHNSGTWHRLQRTKSDSEDTGGLTDFSMANSLYLGADLDNLSADSGGNELEIAVYGEVGAKAPFVPGGKEVPLSWLHMPEDVDAGYQFRVLFVTRSASDATSEEIEDYNGFVQTEAERKYNDPIIQEVASQFRAVVCTAAVDAPTNTGMPTDTIGVPVHWLDGGWEDRPTLISLSYGGFYGVGWVNHDYGAYVTGNSAHFHENSMVWTGCDASGGAHPEAPMGATMGVVAVGTPNDSNANNAPLGAVDVDVGSGFLGDENDQFKRLYAISPIFTVVQGRPAEPENVRGKASGGKVTLNWDPPEHDGGYDITGYRVYWRNPDNGNRWEILRHDVTEKDENDMDVVVERDVELDGDTTTWTDTDDRRRVYGVAAVNQLGESGRVQFVCAAGNGCRQPTPVVKISSDSPLVPSGLRSRDRFRLIFLSSTQSNAESTDIADYNKFVQDLAAAGHADIRAHSAGFGAVACTEAVDARDNTGTNGIGLGIWWLGGGKAVDNYVDFYDGRWDEEVTVRDESGNTVTVPFASSTYQAWTGCEHDGTESMYTGGSRALGTVNPGIGSLNTVASPTNSPLKLSGANDAKAGLHYLYGLSYIFEVR